MDEEAIARFREMLEQRVEVWLHLVGG